MFRVQSFHYNNIKDAAFFLFMLSNQCHIWQSALDDTKDSKKKKLITIDDVARHGENGALRFLNSTAYLCNRGEYFNFPSHCKRSTL